MTKQILAFSFVSLLLISSCSESSEQVDPVDDDNKFIHNILHDEIEGVPVILYANNDQETFVAFERRTNDSEEILEFDFPDDLFPAIITDQHGRTFDINGRLLDNPDVSLKQLNYVLGYWFFFPAMFEQVTFHSGQTISNPNYNNGGEHWSIDVNYVFIGASQDGIPSIDNPQFTTLEGKQLIDHPFYGSLDNEELFTVIQVGQTINAYPHRILEYHEVVNHEVNGIPISLNYCPLTGTSFAWEPMIDGQVVEFGVSGYLFNNNLIMYDRSTESLWSQILCSSVHGEKRGSSISKYQIYETTYQALRKSTTPINWLTTNTGRNYNYNESIYESYKTSSQVGFPLSNADETFHPKQRVIGIVNGPDVKVYTFKDFDRDN